MTRAFTPEQREAIARREGDLMLSANAGSGKTSVLVERSLRLPRTRASRSHAIAGSGEPGPAARSWRAASFAVGARAASKPAAPSTRRSTRSAAFGAKASRTSSTNSERTRGSPSSSAAGQLRASSSVGPLVAA